MNTAIKESQKEIKKPILTYLAEYCLDKEPEDDELYNALALMAQIISKSIYK